MAQVTYEGQHCPHCGTPVIRRQGKVRKKSAIKYTYYYEWFFKCMKCRTVYLVPEARKEITDEQRAVVLGAEDFNDRYEQAQSLF